MQRDHLICANINRFKEGVRVLEDIARFIFKNKDLFIAARKLRHSIVNYLSVRISFADIGGKNFIENNQRSDLLAVIDANASRMTEALRVLEEIGINLISKSNIKSLRYSAYELHKYFLLEAGKYLKINKLKGLYLIIDPGLIAMPIEKIIDLINLTSVSVVQFRSKKLTKLEFLQHALLIKNLLSDDKLLIVNDHVDIALDVADGVHLGQGDYPISRVRALTPDSFIIGSTCHNLSEAQQAENSGASYVSVGCIYPTTSKHDTTPTSLNELRSIRHGIKLPLCTIGGINETNCDLVLQCKPQMLAIISAVWQYPGSRSIIERLHSRILAQ